MKLKSHSNIDITIISLLFGILYIIVFDIIMRPL
ncbi:hypothetical protein CPAST_c39940 [Clostridium pasteurianum DSM 525 = ATCC 6013]|uniref:Uncharacterized protein n=1 Tax=Clostridium pasteurianum DSM 525 = ATCC 6013 TaxID=1262449 RepID=A0A0H3J937_CLOPA|nr:hypothetical protein CPAST_c39940 [Clostridium pasteurianum DSM 525 = ATCC 6013]AJA54012.1 hypothetical protein CLPA_c39940 [Clostridium pasteurianum DSM 525 = ATCC 6013]KRU13963.1 hypothetical protein CP6013_03219 [Clostridium pasteurianum DSM 525 = ATCC 6013]